VANLRGTGTGPRANGNVFLKASGTGATVFDDGDGDHLQGGSGQDWFFANRTGGVRDTVASLAGNELVDEL
jgi:fibronectin-binding autotransporter adhesin